MKPFIYVLALLNFLSSLNIGDTLWGYLRHPFEWSYLTLLTYSIGLLGALFTLLGLGYLLKKPWAWYVTFPQILYSLVYSTSSLCFLTSTSIDRKSLQINSLTLIFEVAKGVLFLLKPVKRFFGVDTLPPSTVRRYRRIASLLLIILLMILASALFGGLSRLFGSS